MRRRIFLVKGLLMASAAASLNSLLESCSVTVEGTGKEVKADQAPKNEKDACAAKGTAARAFFHTHPVQCVTVGQLGKGAGVNLTLTTGFTHEGSLSASQLLELTRGGIVKVESDWTLFHTHLVTFQRV